MPNNKYGNYRAGRYGNNTVLVLTKTRKFFDESSSPGVPDGFGRRGTKCPCEGAVGGRFAIF